MNRLTPLIVRCPRHAFAAPMPMAAAPPEAEREGSGDLRLFATHFVAGLAFFGTYLA
jgi:hypothetical protein